MLKSSDKRSFERTDAYTVHNKEKRGLAMFVYIQCKVSPGAFSGELQFEIALNGTTHRGLASRRYFVTTDKKPMGDLTATTTGMVLARVLTEDEDEKILVSIPDGEVVSVRKDKIVPTSEPQNVPVGS
jgi:hypothetical protein